MNATDIQLTDHFLTILLTMICVDLAVELEKVMGTYYVFSMVFVIIALRHLSYFKQLNVVPENNAPLTFHLRKVLHYELPGTAFINVIYMIFITFSKILFLVLWMEVILLVIVTEEPEQRISPTQASSSNTNFSSVHQQSLHASNIEDANSMSGANNFNIKALRQSDFSKWKRGKEIGSGQYGQVYVYENRYE